MEIGYTDINIASIPLQNSGRTADAGGSSSTNTQVQPDNAQAGDQPQSPDVVTLSTQATAGATSSKGDVSASVTSNANSQTSGDSTKTSGVLKQPQNEIKTGGNTNTAYFAVDDKNNVVIRVIDAKGTIVKQIPPDEYLKMVKSMNEIQGHLFHTKA
jgi:uncharacterized FlaG/YvyC family protein